MDNVRAVIRLFVFFLVTIVLLLLLAPLKLLTWLRMRKQYLCVKQKILHYYSRIVARLIGMRIETRGTPPDPPFFMVSNHLGYMDIIPFWLLTSGTFIGKSEIKSWPFFGVAASLTGILFIDRENKRDIQRVNVLISESMNPCQGVILFPEGTSTKGTTVLPFYPSLLYYPAIKKKEVAYASISYSTGHISKPASNYICWWGDMDFLSHFFNLLKIKSFTARVIFGNRKVMHTDRKILAEKLHQNVKSDFIPVTD